MSRVAVAIGVMLVGVLISRLGKLRLEKQLLVAALRALIQLSIVAVVIEQIFSHLGLSGLFVLVMLVAATVTAAGRWGDVPRARPLAGVCIAAGAGAVLVPVFASGVFDLTPRFVIPLCGIVIGGSMTACSLAGQRLHDDITTQIRVIEQQLALGDDVRTALAPLVRRAATTALIPGVDQTRNVGLITLPGAFVGMLLGGATPIEAAQVQLTVLFLLLAAQAIAAILATQMVARAHTADGQRILADV